MAGLVTELIGGEVLLHRDGVRYAEYAMRAALASQRRNGLPSPPNAVALYRALHTATGRLHASATGSPELPPLAVAGSSTVMDTISAPAAARLLGCTARNVRDLCARGVLTGTRAGGRWHVDRVEVQARLSTRDSA